MKVRIPTQDVPVIDQATGLMAIEWYDALKNLEKLGLIDLASSAFTTVAQLPASGNRGVCNFVTDANSTTLGSIVAGGGTNKVPVYDDGTNWRIG
jgi:hypothetical protein